MTISRLLFCLVFFLCGQIQSAEYPLVLALEKSPETADIRAVQWSADEQHIAVTTDNSPNCLLFNPATAKKELSVTAPATISAATWLDNSHLIFGLTDGRFYIGGLAHSEACPLAFPALKVAPLLLRYCSQKKLLAAAAKSNGTAPNILYLLSPTEQAPITIPMGNISCMEWSHSGNFIAVGAGHWFDPSIQVFPHRPGQGFLNSPQPLSVKPMLRIYPLASQNSMTEATPEVYLQVITDRPISIAWSKDDKLLATLADTGLVEIYSIATKASIASFYFPQNKWLPTELSLSPDNRYLAIGSKNSLIFYDLTHKCIVDCMPKNQLSENCPNLFASFSATIAALAAKRGITNPFDKSVTLDPTRIAYAPSSMLIAIALKDRSHQCSVDLTFPHTLLIFDANSYRLSKEYTLTNSED